MQVELITRCPRCNTTNESTLMNQSENRMIIKLTDELIENRFYCYYCNIEYKIKFVSKELENK